MLAAIRAAHRSPLAAVRDYAQCIARMGESPGGLAHHLAWLQLDLTDPEMHRHLTEQGRIARRALRDWIEEAVTRRELRPATDPDALARTVQVTVNGSLMRAAFDDETPTAAMRRDLEAVLHPWLATGQGKGRARRKPA
jgi:hypothetical protein